MSTQPAPEGAPNAIAPVQLRGPNLLMRPPVLADVAAVTAACQDPEVQRWTTVPSPYGEDDARYFVTEVSDHGWRIGTGATWVLMDPEDSVLLGACGLASIDRTHARAEIGYWVGPYARGRGVASAAVRLACRWAFEELGLARVDWRAYVPSDASRRVAERCGFTVEGTLRSSSLHRGERRDEWFGGLLAGELRDEPGLADQAPPRIG